MIQYNEVEIEAYPLGGNWKGKFGLTVTLSLVRPSGVDETPLYFKDAYATRADAFSYALGSLAAHCR